MADSLAEAVVAAERLGHCRHWRVGAPMRGLPGAGAVDLSIPLGGDGRAYQRGGVIRFQTLEDQGTQVLPLAVVELHP